MLILLSPAKTMDFETKVPIEHFTSLRFPGEAQELVNQLKSYTPKKLSQLMNISDQLAQLNVRRFQEWKHPIAPTKGRQAIFAFKGEVYSGLNATNLGLENIEKAQEEVRILSGIYGLLRPLDLILPYRLEMGTKLKNKKGKDLYAFWGDKITQQINLDLQTGQQQALVNLASLEYFKAVHPKKLNTNIYTPVFKEHKNGTYKVISVYAKKARGLMVQFILKNRLTNPDDMKAFDLEGYHFNSALSQGNEMVFTRH
jgi:cytoplasmic iron level regulating protein YaaA (DUF328/UPF0246 family)